MHALNSNSSTCLHTLTQDEDSVLSLAATEKLLFSGGQGVHGSDIHVCVPLASSVLSPLYFDIQFHRAPPPQSLALDSLICNFKNVVIVCQSVLNQRKGGPIFEHLDPRLSMDDQIPISSKPFSLLNLG